jgi:hypothetical protein
MHDLHEQSGSEYYLILKEFVEFSSKATEQRKKFGVEVRS